MSCLCTMRESCSRCDPELKQEVLRPVTSTDGGYTRSPHFRFKLIKQHPFKVKLSIASRYEDNYIDVYDIEDAEILGNALLQFAAEQRLVQATRGLLDERLDP